MARLRITPRLDQVRREFWRQASGEINAALRRGADEAAGISPVGVSPLAESLRGSWEVEPIRLLEIQKGVIRNNANDALQRIVGSPPRTIVDDRRGSPLFRWAVSKGLPARAVARSIYARGTARWRSGENPFDLDRSGEWQNENRGYPARVTEDIRRRIMRLRF